MSFLNSVVQKFLGFFGQSEEDKKAKETAQAIIKDAEEFGDKATVLYEHVMDFLSWTLEKVEHHLGGLPTKEEFLKVLSYIGDEQIEVPLPLETIDRKVIMYVLNKVDEKVLDRFLGPDWYTNLVERVLEKST